MEVVLALVGVVALIGGAFWLMWSPPGRHEIGGDRGSDAGGTAGWPGGGGDHGGSDSGGSDSGGSDGGGGGGHS